MDAPLAANAIWPDANWKRRLRRRLLGWFAHAARDLPWRRTRDCYAVWVSEIMLQQTQVATVVPYYKRFLQRFPDANSLAAAHEEEVLKHWEGLGYYRRARQMHRAAQQIVALHDGVFPQDMAAVLALPGVGRYTAGAILSIALDQCQPILEANTIRLFSRLLYFSEDPHSTRGQQTLWAFAEDILPRKATGQFNQALMELGATLCLPAAPKCSQCPVAPLCPTNQHGRQSEIPLPKRKQQYEEIHEASILLRKGPHVLLRKCPEGERWAGLWGFPRFRVASPEQDAEKISLALHEAIGVRAQVRDVVTKVRHQVTRYRIRLTCYEADWVSGEAQGNTEFSWTTTNKLVDFPLHVSARKIAQAVCRREAKDRS